MKTLNVLLIIIFGACLAACSKNSLAFRDDVGNAPILRSPLDTVGYGLVYDTYARVGKREMSGLLYLRQTSPDVWRVALTAKLGQTLFDFEIRRDSMIIRQCLEQLRKDIILDQLERDFRLITGNIPWATGEVIREQSGESEEIKWRLPGSKRWIHQAVEGGWMTRLAWGKKRKEKTIVTFSEYVGEVPSRIHVDHHTIVNFDLEMQRIP